MSITFAQEYAERMKELQSRLPGGVDGALITSEISRRYMTGFPSSDGFLVVTRDSSVFTTDSRYTEAAENQITNCKVIGFKKIGETMSEIAKELNIKKVLIEGERVTLSEAARYEKLFTDLELVKTDELDGILNSMRVSKSEYEIEKIKEAQAITEASLQYVLNNVLREGVTEKELALEIEFYMRKNGAERIAFDLIVAAGANSSMPHAVPSDYKIQKGDFITFDIGAVVDGYHSDMTRTVVFGKANDEQKLIYNTVLRAQQVAIDYVINGGKVLSECDAAARKVISDAGYGAYFGHSTGHGVGVEIHETPSVAPSSTGEIPTGAVITVEPGIYLPGKGGVRIENMVYKTEDSGINLTNLPRELLELG